MRIIKEINIQPEKLSSGLSAALGVCKIIRNSPDASDTIDFSFAQFVTPTFVLPMIVYIKGLDKEITFEHTGSYMQSICFDNFGVDSGTMRRTEFTAFLEQYSDKRKNLAQGLQSRETTATYCCSRQALTAKMAKAHGWQGEATKTPTMEALLPI